MDEFYDPEDLWDEFEDEADEWDRIDVWDASFEDVESYPYETEQPADHFAGWAKFLFVATFLACTGVASLLYLLTAQISYASDGGSDQVDRITTALIENQGPLPLALGGEAAIESGDCQVSERFPGKIRKWCSMISQYSAKRGLPPDLVAAVILQESGGNPAAYSQSGAVGLMQVMPRDGLAASFMCVNGPCFSNRPSSAELQDPDFNVSYGTKMLAGLVGKHGDIREALRSYGPMDAGYTYADKVLGIYQRYGQ